MAVTLPEEYEAFLRDFVASGRFRTADEAVGEGLRMLQRQEQRRGTLSVDLQEGIDALDAGDVSVLDVDDITQRGHARRSERQPGST